VAFCSQLMFVNHKVEKGKKMGRPNLRFGKRGGNPNIAQNSRHVLISGYALQGALKKMRKAWTKKMRSGGSKHTVKGHTL